MEGTQHPITDAGRRLSEAHNTARAAGGEGRFLAVSLADGSVTSVNGQPTIYDTHADAVRHNDDAHHAFLCVHRMHMPPGEGTHWLELMRRLSGAGWKLTDPDRPIPIPDLAPRRRPAGPHDGSGLVVPPAFGQLLMPDLEPLNRAARRALRRRHP